MKFVFLVLSGLYFSGCATQSRLVYSSGFSFQNYDYVIVNKTDGSSTSTSLFGLDVEFANLMSRYNMKIIGDKEYDKLPEETKKRTLSARISFSQNTNSSSTNILSVSFDDTVTGRTGTNITTKVRGDMFDAHDRNKAFEKVSEPIIRAIASDKGLKVTEE